MRDLSLSHCALGNINLVDSVEEVGVDAHEVVSEVWILLPDLRILLPVIKRSMNVRLANLKSFLCVGSTLLLQAPSCLVPKV